jgi:translation initiation factor RLI1
MHGRKWYTTIILPKYPNIPLGSSDFLTMNHYVDGKKYFTNENVRVRKKMLELNVEKTKRMMFNKRKRVKRMSGSAKEGK